MKKRWAQRGTYRFFKCPQCRQIVRVPKGRGKICITCPKCKTEFMLLTKRIRDVGQMIGIELVDHIVIGDNRYTSFRESGYL